MILDFHESEEQIYQQKSILIAMLSSRSVGGVSGEEELKGYIWPSRNVFKKFIVLQLNERLIRNIHIYKLIR